MLASQFPHDTHPTEIQEQTTIDIKVNGDDINGGSADFYPSGTITDALTKENSFNPDPLYDDVAHYSMTIAVDDPADIYFPVLPGSTQDTLEFPIALLLQGSLVDKSNYSIFASEVASYGFVVVVPNHERTFVAPTGESITGFFSEPQQINDVLTEMVVEDADPSSQIFEIVDIDKLGLLGHSFGGAIGLSAIQTDLCLPEFCTDDYTQPPELMAGIFYGTSFRDPETDVALPVNNQDIPTGLIVGDRDGVVQPSFSEETYDQILNPPKALITVEGANHYGITNEDDLVRESSRPTLDQATATETIARWSALFLRSHLLRDKGALDYVYNTGDALDRTVSVISQSQPIV